MKKKKFIALITALTLLLTAIMPSAIFADTISKEAKACADLGILIGKDLATGVTSEYLKEIPTRIQALIIFLRIQGLEDEAITYDWSDNFKDSDDYSWVVGRNYLGYAKENPDLGWIGSTDGNFYPNNTIDSKAFYKVMLESLDYNQDIDFDYNDTLEFAESVGVLKSASSTAKVKNFTIDHVAKAIYTTLNTKPKDETKSLITLMIDKGIIDEKKAVKAGFKIEVNPIEVLSFERLSNNKFLLTLDNETILDEDDVNITTENGKKDIAVESIETDGEKVYITAAPMPAFEAYYLNIDMDNPVNGMAIKDYSEKFVALPRDTKKAKAVAEIVSNNIIKITFDKEMDKSSAEDSYNYTIQNDIDIEEIELDKSGKVATIITAPQREGNRYWLDVRSVVDLSGNPMEFLEKSYTALPRDRSKPVVTTVHSESGKIVVVNFNEPVNRILAERVENYSIQNDDFTIEDAFLDDAGKTVRLRTSGQNPDRIYRITIKNIADLAGNVMDGSTKSFSGASGSGEKFSFSVTSISSNEIKIKFTRKVEKDSAENINNYYIDNNLTVEGAFLAEDNETVDIVTSDQKSSVKYTIEASNIYDAYGSVLSYDYKYFIGRPADSAPLSYTAKSSEDGVILTFNKRVDKKSAENVFNYILDSSLGYAARATVDNTGKIVTLLTKSHNTGKVYTIVVENVMDLAGETIDSDDKVAKRNFIGFGDTKDKDLRLDAINAYDTASIDLYFDNPLNNKELDDLEVFILTEDNESYSKPKGLEYQKYFSADKSTVRIQFKTDSSNNPDIFRNGRLYEVRVTNLDRLQEDSYANIKSFSGTSQTNEPPYIVDAFAINSTAVEVNFSKPVKGISPSQFTISETNIIGASVEPGDIVTTATLYLNNNKSLSDGKEYKLTAKSGIKDAAGFSSIPTSSNKNSIEFIGVSYKNEPPMVYDVSALDKYTLTVEFSEPISIPSSSGFTIRRIPSGGSSIAISNAVLSDDKQTVTIYLNSQNAPISTNYEYELNLGANVKDLQGLSLDADDRKYEFDGSDVYLPGFEIIAESISGDNKTITLVTSNPISNKTISMEYFEISGANYSKSSSDKIEVEDRTIKITLRNALKANSKVNIQITKTGQNAIKDLNNQKMDTEDLEIYTN